MGTEDLFLLYFEDLQNIYCISPSKKNYSICYYYQDLYPCYRFTWLASNQTFSLIFNQ